MIGFRYIRNLAASAGILACQPVMTPHPVVRLINGSFIEFRSWEREQNLMGTPIAGGVIDEAGLLTPTGHSAISSRRSSTLGPLHYIGNPGLVAGPFRRLCAIAEQTGSLHRWTWQDKHAALMLEDPGAAKGYADFIEQERRSLPEFEFRRLYEAEWTEDEAAVFRGLDACLDRSRASLLGPGADAFSVGVDVAQMSDYLAVASYAKAARRLELRYRVRGIGYPQAAVEVDRITRELNATAVVEENGPGIALIQELQRLGTKIVPFTTTSQSKQELILGLAADIQQARVQIADHAPMPYEFATYRYERGPSGLYRYSAPPGEHDDTVMAAALARWGATRTLTGADAFIEYLRRQAEKATA